MFDVTIILYIYLFIIIMLILFNITYSLRERINDKIKIRKYNHYYITIKDLETKNSKAKYTKEHIKYLKRKLKRINNLLIYYDVIQTLKKENEEFCQNYLVTYQEIFTILINQFKRKEPIKKAYFASFVTGVYPFNKIQSSVLDEFMMDLIKDNSIYCRQNAMLYLYKRGSAELVVNALKIFSNLNLYYNKKLLSNDLLKFTGSKKQLMMQLLENFNEFSSNIQTAIINFSRYTECNFCAIFYEMLISGKYEKEVDLALIRYFGKNTYPKVLPYLLNFLEDKDSDNVEYRIVITQILEKYDKKIVRDILIKSTCDLNWYVRKNAANSLSKMSLSEEDKKKINAIEDRYGKEIINYSFLQKDSKKKGKEKVCTN